MDRAAHFEEHGFAVCPGMLDARSAGSFLESTSYLPENRVQSQSKQDEFASQDLPWVHPLHYFLVRQGLDMTRRVTGEQRALREAACWTSIYRVAKYIAPHRDAAGDMQFLIVLRRPPSECGGALHIIDRARKEHVLDLQLGDGLVFHAHELTHFTEPLRATRACPEPQRVVAVGRYFFVARAD